MLYFNYFDNLEEIIQVLLEADDGRQEFLR
jgi:hypothetical protein